MKSIVYDVCVDAAFSHAVLSLINTAVRRSILPVCLLYWNNGSRNISSYSQSPSSVFCIVDLVRSASQSGLAFRPVVVVYILNNSTAARAIPHAWRGAKI